MSTETVILENLVLNEAYFRKVITHLKPEYFTQDATRGLCKAVIDHATKYSARPPIEALEIAVDQARVSADTHAEMKDVVTKFRERQEFNSDLDWLSDMTEKFCKDQALFNAITQSISILEGEDKRRSKNEILDLVQGALSVSFDSAIGHEYMVEANSQYSFYTDLEEKMPCHLATFNDIMNGGPTKKTINVLMSNRTGGFKSGTMCDLASRYYVAGKNVLYITMEMSERRIRERVDANLLNVPIDDLRSLSKSHYMSSIDTIAAGTPGKLVIKEYPTSSAHVGHFRFLLKELRQKKNFVPDVIFVDYINICASQRLAGNSSVNSYTWVKSITEELRALAVEQDVVMWSATQSGRQGVSAEDGIDMDDVSESYGLPVTVDMLLAIITTEELSNRGLIMFKQIKNRYKDENYRRKFVLGIDKSRMKLFESDDSRRESRTFLPPSARKDSPAADNRNVNSFKEWDV